MFLLILHLCFFGVVFGNDCCPENSWPIRSSRPTRCSDNTTHINLNCSHKFFMVNPNVEEFDKFEIDEAGNLLLSDGSYNVSSSEFCIVSKWPINETSFHPEPVAFVCFTGKVKDRTEENQIVVFRNLEIVSTFFLVLTLIIYLVIPGVRDLSGKCIITFIFCLISFYVSLISIQFDDSGSYSMNICTFLAFFTYFWSVSSFFWLNVITFNIWRSVMRKGFEISDNKWIAIYFCWGFGIPLLLTFTSLLVENLPGKHIKPNMGKYRCWFEGHEATWSFFYGPIAVLLIVNIIMFLMTSLKLQKNYEPSTLKRTKSLRIKFMLHLKLFILMGVTWIFEIISFAAPSPIWVVTDYFNCAQGIIIFLVLVIFRKKVFLNILKIHFCGLKCPCAANEIQDEESETKYDFTTAEATELKNTKGLLSSERSKKSSPGDFDF